MTFLFGGSLNRKQHPNELEQRLLLCSFWIFAHSIRPNMDHTGHSERLERTTICVFTTAPLTAANNVHKAAAPLQHIKNS